LILYVFSRLLQTVALCLLASALVFLAVYALGNPVAALINPSAPPEVVAETIKRLGLDQPLYVQYLRFLTEALHGNLGISYTSSRSALQLIFERLPATLELTLLAISIALLAGIPAGLVAGYWPRTWFSKAIGTLSVVGISMPSFWIGLLLITTFSIRWGWLPSGGRGVMGEIAGIRSSLFTIDGLRHLILPATNLSFFPLALIVRLTRAGVIENASAPHIRFARAKGLSPSRVLFRYMLPSIAIPIVTVIGIVFGVLFAYGVVTETVFAWPGIGKLIIESIRTNDRPVVIAYLLFTVCLFAMINLAVDLVCAVIDPRISLSSKS
jgi:peptide/nickel transport system permease protein